MTPASAISTPTDQANTKHQKHFWKFIFGGAVLLTGLAIGLFFVFQKPATTSAQTSASITGDGFVGGIITGSYTHTGYNRQLVGTQGFSSGPASYLSLKFDNLIPYITYQDGGNSSKATVMKFNSGTNAWEVVGIQGFSDGSVNDISLSIDNGTPYVAYTDGGNYQYGATVMKFNSGTNTWEAVGNTQFSDGRAYYTSLSFYNGTPYVAYQDGYNGDGMNNGKATVMKLNSGTNTWEVVGNQAFSSGYAYYTSLSFYNGTPYVAYQDGGKSNKATVMKFNSGTNAWEVVGIQGFSLGNGSVSYLSLVIDGNGIPYVAYMDSMIGDNVTVMKFDGSSWVVVGTRGFSSGQAYYISLAIDNGIPYVGYMDGGLLNKATVMKFNSNINSWEIVGNQGFSSGKIGYTSLAIDGNGIPYMGYQDITGSDSKATIMKFVSDIEGASTYKWYRNGVEINGATGITYTLTTGDAGKIITFEVERVSSGGVHDAPALSSGLEIAAPTAINISIYGQNYIGGTLTAAYTYNYSPDPIEGASIYKWYRDGSEIIGETSTGYTVITGDAGKTITFGITPISIGGTIGTEAISNPLIITAPTVNSVVISGNNYSGQTLIGTYIYNYIQDPIEGVSTYKWYRNGSEIIGETSTGYTITVADEGTTLTFEVTPVSQAGIIGTSGTSNGISINTIIPTTSNVYITGLGFPNQLLTGIYTYINTNLGQRVYLGDHNFSNLVEASIVSSTIDSNGIPYVAYVDKAHSNHATVMKYNGTSWVVVGTPGFSDYEVVDTISIAMDSNNMPVVAYSEKFSSQRATVKKFNGSSWNLVGPLNFSSENPKYISLDLDSNDIPYIVYADYAPGGAQRAMAMKFDTNTNNWIYIGAQGFSNGDIKDASLKIDSNNIPYVAFIDHNQAEVWKFNANTWTIVGGVITSANAGYTTLVLDSHNIPYVGYEDSAKSNSATVRRWDGHDWKLLGQQGFSPETSDSLSIAMDNTNTPYVAYVNNINGGQISAMKYNTSNGKWETILTDRFTNGSNYVSININNNNYIPYVTFKDASNKVSVMKTNLGDSGFLEGNSLYQWYIDGNIITGATGLIYTTQATDIGSYIIFEVTPVSQLGIAGDPMQSTGFYVADPCGNGNIDIGETCDDGSINGIPGYCNLTCDGQTPTFDCATVTDISVPECEALVDLFNSTDGIHRNNITNRFHTTTAGNRYGVGIGENYTCCLQGGQQQCPSDPSIDPNCSLIGGGQQVLCMASHGQQITQLSCHTPASGVTNLSFGNGMFEPSNNLSGIIESSFANLIYLKKLYFRGNTITSLPETLTGLSNLQIINPNENYLSPCTMTNSLRSFITNIYGDNSRESTQTNSCPICGNSVIETGEVCDDGGYNGQAGYCNALCSGPSLDMELLNINYTPTTPATGEQVTGTIEYGNVGPDTGSGTYLFATLGNGLTLNPLGRNTTYSGGALFMTGDRCYDGFRDETGVYFETLTNNIITNRGYASLNDYLSVSYGYVSNPTQAVENLYDLCINQRGQESLKSCIINQGLINLNTKIFPQCGGPKVFVTTGDICYDDLLNETGIYFDKLSEYMINSRSQPSINDMFINRYGFSSDPSLAGERIITFCTDQNNGWGYKNVEECLSSMFSIDPTQYDQCGIDISSSAVSVKQIPDLGAGETGAVDIDMQVDNNFTCGNDITNTFKVISNTYDTNPLNNSFENILTTSCQSHGAPTADTDADGIPDTGDNCPLVANPGQETSAAVVFTKANFADWTLPENQDRITNNVWLTRKNTQGLFNIFSENGYTATSPAGTEWTDGTCISASGFTNMATWFAGNPSAKINVPACLHLITDNKYYNITITSILGGGGGGFSYTRTDAIGLACNCSDLVCTTGTDYTGNLICNPDPACTPPTNTPPLGTGTMYTTDENTTLHVSAASGVLSSLRASDVDNNTLSVILNTIPIHGTLTMNTGDGSFEYIPNQYFNSTDQFTYYLFDGTDTGNLVTATIKVNPDLTTPSDTVDIPDTQDTTLIITEFENKQYLDASGAINNVPAGTYVGTKRIYFGLRTDGESKIPFVLQSSGLADKIEVKAPGDMYVKTDSNSGFTGILNRPILLNPTVATQAGVPNVLAVVEIGNSQSNTPLYFKDASNNPVNVQLRIPLPLGTPFGSLVRVLSSHDGVTWTTTTVTSVGNISGKPYAFASTSNFTMFAIGTRTGSFTINNDAATTTTDAVTLNIVASGAVNMRFQNDTTGGTRSSRETYSTTKTWTLSAGTGTKTVYAQFDTDGTTTTIEANTSDSINYTTGAIPIGGNVTGNVWLEISTNSGSCVYGTSIDLGSHTSQFASFDMTGANFSSSFYCSDTEGLSGWTMTMQASSDLTNGAQTIPAANVSLMASANYVSIGMCTTGANDTSWISIGVNPGIIINKAGIANDICTVKADTVNLAVHIPNNQAIGIYTGTLSLDMPF